MSRIESLEVENQMLRAENRNYKVKNRVMFFLTVWETVAPPNFICLCVCLSVCLSVCVSVCPAFTGYISVTMGWILIKLGGNVETLVQLIVFKFEHSAAKGKTTHKGVIFFFCISMRFRAFRVD